MQKLLIHSVLYTLFAIGSLHAEKGDHYGLAPLKDRESAHLEKRIRKVVRIKPNSIGAERILQSLEKNHQSGSINLGFDDDEFNTALVSSDEAVGMIGAGDPLPSSVNNSLLPCFPPIGDQGQIGSCVGWGSTYYQASHEIALLNELNNKASNRAILSPKWTYDILNDGFDQGLSVLDAYQLLSINGAPSIANFPYDSNYTAWSLNSLDWISAINNRMSDYNLIPGLGGSGPQNLTAIKTALVNGHILTFATFINSWVFTRIKNDPQNINNAHINEYAAVYMNGTNGGHFMTIVGYDDNLWIDVNGNGSVDPGERGAFLVANSWGTSWGNQGFIWISYDAFRSVSAVSGGPSRGRVAAGTYLNSSVISIVPKAKNYTPSLVAQFSLSQTDRSQISIQAGVSNTNQTAPSTFLSNYALANMGGALGFNGMKTSTAQTATFALDLTDLLPSFSDPKLKRYYLTVSDNKTGAPTRLNSFALVAMVHKTQVSYPHLPKTFDRSSGTLFLDYNFSDGLAPEPEAPIVSFLSPMAGDLLTGTANVSVSATGTAGISSVQFYVDGTLIGALTESMSAYNGSIDTTRFSNGAHQLKAVAADGLDYTSQVLLNVEIHNSASRPSFYIDAGGPTLSALGQTWTADTGYFSGGSGVYSKAISFANPIYQTERFGNMSYRFTLPNGNYAVTLKFAELYFKKKNQRLFNVLLNGAQVINRLDLFAAAGYGVPYDRTFPVTVSSGTLNIVFKSVKEKAQINGIQIVPLP